MTGAYENFEPHIVFLEEYGSIEVHDRRLFRRGHESFCRRLVETAAQQRSIRSASVSLGSATCRLEFEPGWRTADCMATQFAAIMNETIKVFGRSQVPVGSGMDWATVSAFPAKGGVSCWEAMHETPDRLRLHNEILCLDSTIARAVAIALRQIPGILSCRVVSFRRDLIVAYDPWQRAALAVVDAAESCLRQIRSCRLTPAKSARSGGPETGVGPPQLSFLARVLDSVAPAAI